MESTTSFCGEEANIFLIQFSLNRLLFMGTFDSHHVARKYFIGSIENLLLLARI